MLQVILQLAKCHLVKERLHSSLNILGLSLGLTSYLLISFYINSEKEFDQFHSKIDRTFRLISSVEGQKRAIVPYTWGEKLKSVWPQVDQLATVHNITTSLSVFHKEEVFAQHGIMAVDSAFLDIFDFPIIEGDRKTLFKKPNGIAITSSTASKYFGNEDPLGKQLSVNLWGEKIMYEVEGIIECPINSHLQFEMLLPIFHVRNNFFNPRVFSSWKAHFTYTYVTLVDGSIVKENYSSVRDYLESFLTTYGGVEVSDKYDPHLESVKNLYLNSDILFDFEPRGSSSQLETLKLIAFGILLMSMINFTNINSAQILKRNHSLGIQKILGSSKKNLLSQVFIESLFLIIISVLISIILILMVIPFFNEITDKSFKIIDFLTISNLWLVILLTFALSFLLSLYPSILAIKSRASVVGGNNYSVRKRSVISRKALVTIQFSVVIMLLFGLGVVYLQVHYMESKELGFEKDQVLVLPNAREVASNPSKTELFKKTLSGLAGIQSITSSSSYPGIATWSSRYRPEGYQVGESGLTISTFYADFDWPSTYSLEFTDGRNFDRTMFSDSTGIMINEAAQRLFASADTSWLSEPLQKNVYNIPAKKDLHVIGVVKDFHFENFESDINPAIISNDPSKFFSLQIKINSSNVQETIKKVEDSWKALFPEIPFEYSFLDSEFDKLFQVHKRLKDILLVFAVIAIVISIMGLFGLTNFLAQEKSKEMGIRKIVGANENQLLLLLTKSFLVLICLALVLSIPTSYLLMDVWLDQFAFRIDIPFSLITLVILTIVCVAFSTILHHMVKLTKTNPIEVIRDE